MVSRGQEPALPKPPAPAALPVAEIPNRPVSYPLVPPTPLESAVPVPLPLPSERFESWFRIGYLRPADESPLSEGWYRDLQAAFQSDPEFGAFVKQGSISGVALRPCDGPVDMLQRMLQMELDMAFCPAMVYAQERLQRDNRSRYHVLFQMRRRGEPTDSHGGPYVRHRGVLFARRGSDLDVASDGLRREDVQRLLSNRILAVSGSYDAAGYFYIRKRLWEEYHASPREVLFCGSPHEVVKAVVSGLVDVGGCEERVLREVFDALPAGLGRRPDLDSQGNNDFVRTLMVTQWVPVDPVVMRAYYCETPSRAGRESVGPAIGRAAANVIKRFYNDPRYNAPQLEQPRTDPDLVYETLVKDVQLTRGYGW